MSGTDPIYDEHDPADLPPELQPLPEVDWDELSSPAVERAVRGLNDDDLRDVPGDTRLLRGVLALGVGVRFGGEIVPTVAGLVAFGLHPELVLPGLQVQVQVDGRVPDVWTGPVPVIRRHVGRHPVLRARVGKAESRELVAHALAWRSWEDGLADHPVLVTLDGDTLRVRYPGAVERADAPPNPVLAELFWRAGWVQVPSASPGPLRRALSAWGVRGPRMSLEGGWTVLRATLAPRSEVRPRAPAPQIDPVEATRPTTQRAAPAPAVADDAPADPVFPPPDAPADRPGGHRSAKDRLAELVETLEDAGRMTRRDLQRRLGWSRSTLRNVLRAAVDGGRVLALAPSPRSPFQVYAAARTEPTEHPQAPAASVAARR